MSDNEPQVTDHVNFDHLMLGQLTGIAKWEYRDRPNQPKSVYKFTLTGILEFSGMAREVEMIGEKDGSASYKGYFTIKQPDGEMRADFAASEISGNAADFSVTSATGIFSPIESGVLYIVSQPTAERDEFAWTVAVR